MTIELKINLYCGCCGQKLETTDFYKFGSNQTAKNVVPCKKGCSEKDLYHQIKIAKKEEQRRANLPRESSWGDQFVNSR